MSFLPFRCCFPSLSIFFLSPPSLLSPRLVSLSLSLPPLSLFLARHHLEEQYARYVNRYGGGLVIYWAGFDERLLGPPPMPPTTSAAGPAPPPGSGPRLSPAPPRAGVAVAATLPAALRGALRTLPRLSLPARAAPAPAALLAE